MSVVNINKTERVQSFIDFMNENGTPLISVDFLDWLIEKGFFTKPAAIKYHGNYTGGLFDHSKAVAETLVLFTEKLGLNWENPRSPYIIGMFHDLCKIDDYITETNEEIDGEDENVKWSYNNNKILKGHGDKSIMLLSQFINLTEEEIFCIRFHMGAYETENWDSYDKAIRKYETVLWTHTADMFASKILNT